MKKTILILATSLAIFLITFELTLNYAESTVEEDANHINTQAVLLLQKQLDERLTWTDNGKVKDPVRLRNFLKRSLPYDKDESAIVLTDSVGNILLATDPYYEKYKNVEELEEVDSDEMLDSDDMDENVCHYEVVNNNKIYHGYFIKLKYVPWNIVLVCSNSVIFLNAQSFKHFLWFICAVGFLLTLLCAWFVYREAIANLTHRIQLDHELSMAASLQQHMLKKSLLEQTYFTLEAYLRPALNVGGDLYDYAVVNGKLVFCIGDVSGKGMPAALFMAQAISLFRNTVRFIQEPSKIARQINDVLSQENPTMTFCTFIVGTLENGSLRLCNAGHTRPILIRQGTKEFLPLKPHTALGIMEGFGYTTEELQLQSGDTFLLYTDGVTEAKGTEGRLFGDEQLLRSIQPDDTIPSVLRALSSHVGKEPQSDDITMLKLHLK